MASLSSEELDDLATLAWDALMTGVEGEELRDSLALDEEDFSAVLTRMFDAKASEVRNKPTEHVYVQYILDQGRNIADLTTLVQDFKKTRQHSAMVSAIKARSDIQDKILQRGQEFGLIASAQDGKGLLLAGIMIQELTNDELRRAVVRELRDINTMMKDSGDADFIDVEVKEIHRGPALPPEDMGELEAPKVEPLPIKPKKKKKKQRVRIGGRRG